MSAAIVTGGTRGIGRAIAKAIAADGRHVMITGVHREHIDDAVRSLGLEIGHPDRIAGMAADVRDRSAVNALVDETVHRFGSLDTLVNNAGVGAFSDVGAMSEADWSRVIDTNLTGVFHCTQAALPHLKRAGGAWIINIASLAGRNAFPGGSAYCASKAGLIAFTEVLMQEVRYDDIRVSVIMPGSVATEFSPRSGDDSWKLSPDDVAETVMDLLRHPGRSLPSRVEMRPAKPRKP